MRIIKAALLLILMLTLLTGCSFGSQVEDQAYILVMGLDRTPDGQIELTVQIPKISGSMGESGSKGKSENYMCISITAEKFEAALEKLDWASTRDVNLAQMKLIVLSRELASEAKAKDLIANIAQTERLFTATKVAVCEGSAKNFVEAIQPSIGTRISTDIDAMFAHYNNRGYVPESSLADLYYHTESIYSDPMVTYALLNKEALKEQKEIQPVSAYSGSIQNISASIETDIPTVYLGAAVFSNGQMKAVLSGEETILINLLRNELKSFRYENGGQSMEFVPTRPVYLNVDTKSDPIKIKANIVLSYAAQEQIPDENSLKANLTRDLEDTIRFTQRMQVEPFGFAERAARKFLTISDWIEFDWIKKYSDAKIELELRFAQSDA